MSECIEKVSASERGLVELLAAIRAEPTQGNQPQPTSMSASHDDHAKHKKGQRKSATKSGKGANVGVGSVPQEGRDPGQDEPSGLTLPVPGSGNADFIKMLEEFGLIGEPPAESAVIVVDEDDPVQSVYRKLISSGGKGLKLCLRFSERLIRVRKTMGQADFEEYVRQRLGMEPETASDYIRLYMERDRLPKSDKLLDLRLSEAIELLDKARGKVDTEGKQPGHGSSGRESKC